MRVAHRTRDFAVQWSLNSRVGRVWIVWATSGGGAHGIRRTVACRVQ